MSPRPPIRVFSGDTSLDIECQRHNVELTFRRKADEQAYEKLNAALRERARCAIDAESVGSNGELDYFVLDDWWPNRTVAIEIDRSPLTTSLLLGLWNLLDGPYATWSIAIEVYERFASEDPRALGPMRVFAQEILITQQIVAAVAGEA
jgi:hypothetical protein